MVQWFDAHSGFASFMITFSLVLITIYYAYQTKKQVDNSNKILEEESKRTLNTGINYLYLLNSEMVFNENILVNYIYFESNLENEKGILITSYSNELKELDFKTWEMVKSEIPKYFSSKVVEELVGYYCGIEYIKLKHNNLYNDEIIELAKVQIVQMHKCVDLIEENYGIKLRGQEIFLTDGYKIIVNKENGNLIIDKKTS